jgi:hypothetical protein
MENKLVVAIRCKPSASDGGCIAISADSGEVNLTGPEKNHRFKFAHTYSSPGHEPLYDDAVRPLVDGVLQGYTGTVFTYGQTGSGKTYTLCGVPEDRGLVPLACEQIFNHISTTPDCRFMVNASYLQIYNAQVEELQDLLSKPDPLKQLELKEHTEVRRCAALCAFAPVFSCCAAHAACKQYSLHLSRSL